MSEDDIPKDNDSQENGEEDTPRGPPVTTRGPNPRNDDEEKIHHPMKPHTDGKGEHKDRPMGDKKSHPKGDKKKRPQSVSKHKGEMKKSKDNKKTLPGRPINKKMIIDPGYKVKKMIIDPGFKNFKHFVKPSKGKISKPSKGKSTNAKKKSGFSKKEMMNKICKQKLGFVKPNKDKKTKPNPKDDPEKAAFDELLFEGNKLDLQKLKDNVAKVCSKEG